MVDNIKEKKEKKEIKKWQIILGRKIKIKEMKWFMKFEKKNPKKTNKTIQKNRK